MGTPVYIVNYYYIERYCSPNPENWEKQNEVLLVTTDIEKARQCKNEYNSKPWHERPGEDATIAEYELT